MSTMRLTTLCTSMALMCFLGAARLHASALGLLSSSEQLTSVSSRVFNGYVRPTNPDGSFRAETYAFGNGGMVSAGEGGISVTNIAAMGGGSGVVTRDPTIDDVGFDSIARTIARPLGEQDFVPTRDAKGTDILIMVYWGRSVGSDGDQNGMRKDYVDERNAHLMGFDSERFIQDRVDFSTVFTGRTFRSMLLDNLHSSVLTALEVNRYFVILRAFDFQAAWKQKKVKLLWETRFSLSEREHDFEKELPTMAHTASKYFGQDTHGLIQASIPEGSVEIGDVRSLGNVQEK
jgi:hypothetical protein